MSPAVPTAPTALAPPGPTPWLFAWWSPASTAPYASPTAPCPSPSEPCLSLPPPSRPPPSTLPAFLLGHPPNIKGSALQWKELVLQSPSLLLLALQIQESKHRAQEGPPLMPLLGASCWGQPLGAGMPSAFLCPICLEPSPYNPPAAAPSFLMTSHHSPVPSPSTPLPAASSPSQSPNPTLQLYRPHTTPPRQSTFCAENNRKGKPTSLDGTPTQAHQTHKLLCTQVRTLSMRGLALSTRQHRSTSAPTPMPPQTPLASPLLGEPSGPPEVPPQAPPQDLASQNRPATLEQLASPALTPPCEKNLQKRPPLPLTTLLRPISDLRE
ncbi:hypothetical protein E4T56_gene1023 [Termitomyces sp. T112]|nr:hypothetical protein E4T56_gene1023 [Termitomyces sp. T112]